ncbi:MAG TPA: ABC transporter substrate-binding protein [Xanthobacteraceae bacterium]|jgi:NitT/TauT family transport system substrate-binding protein
MLRMRYPAAVLAALLIFATSSARAEDLIPFRMGISAPSFTILPVHFADAGGFYEKHGLKVEIVNSEGGTRGIQVLLSGEMQAMHVGLAPAVQANLKGADLRLVAATVNLLPFTVFGTKRTDPPLQKGATVAISTFGSETDIAVSVMLKQLGMTRDDVNITQIGGTTQRFGAMVAGRVDAAPLLEPAVSAAREKGFPVVVDLAAQKTPWIFDAVVVTQSYLKEHPDNIRRFLMAYIEGAERAFGDEKWAKEVIGKRFKTSDPKIIDATYADYVKMTARDLAPSVEGARSVLAQLKAINLPVGSDNVADYLDLRFIDELKADGFVAAAQKQFGVK